MAKSAQRRLCVIHNNVAEASSRLEVSEQRVVAYLTSLISKNDKDFQVYPVAVKDLSAILGLNRKDFYKEVKDTTKNLVKKVMSLQRLDGPGELQVAWLSSAEYKDGEGVVELEFSPKLKPYLLQLKEHFTKYPLKDVIRFRSQFSMPIYLLLKQYLTVGYRQFTIEELREKLALGNKYAQYGIFKIRILNTAVKEINERTSLTVNYDEIREGRKVVAVRFTMHTKPPQPADVDMFQSDSTDPAQDEVKQARDTIAATTTADPVLLELSKYMPVEKAQEWLDTKGTGFCRANLTYARQNAKRNLSAYLGKSLDNNYAGYGQPKPGVPGADPNCPKCHGTGRVAAYPEGFENNPAYEVKLDCDCLKNRH